MIDQASRSGSLPTWVVGSPAGREPVRSALACRALVRAGKIAVALLFGGLAAACDAPTSSRASFAFDPTTLSGGRIYRWEAGRTIRVWVDPSDTTTLVNLPTAVSYAVGIWNDQLSFREFALEVVSDANTADVLVFDRSRPLPFRAGSCQFDPRGAIGYTYFCPAVSEPTRAERLTLANGSTGAATVVIAIDRGRVTTQLAYVAAVTHEMGHVLGIGGHSPDTRDVMYGVPTATVPTDRDVATLLFVLGSRPDFRL